MDFRKLDDISNAMTMNEFYKCVNQILQRHPNKLYYIVEINIDLFKTVSELFGYEEGKTVLSFFSNMIHNTLRIDEAYAHKSNDIFFILVRRSVLDIKLLLNQLTEKMNTYPLSMIFSISMGVAEVRGTDCSSIPLVCQRASLAGQCIKKRYMNRFAVYEEWMREDLVRRHFILSYMHQALEKGEFIIYLQPQYDLFLKSIVGAEALVRWKHDMLGFITPNEFIPLLEENEFIFELDEYVWELACKTIRSWINRGITPIPISVNVSVLDLIQPEFCDKVLGLTVKYQISPSLLILEITESQCMKDVGAFSKIVERLHQYGFVVAMDDFGSGNASLILLKSISFDRLKLDSEFVLFEGKEDIGRILLESVVELARRLHIDVVAEGVEKKSQVDLLKAIDCHVIQGYYFCKPVAVDQFETLYLK